jgi:hypothetical protein
MEQCLVGEDPIGLLMVGFAMVIILHVDNHCGTFCNSKDIKFISKSFAMFSYVLDHQKMYTRLK